MIVLLRVLAVYMAIETHMTQAELTEDTTYISDIECVSQRVTNGSTWECGYCLDVEQQRNKRTIMGQKMDNETDCQTWINKGS